VHQCFVLWWFTVVVRMTCNIFALVFAIHYMYIVRNLPSVLWHCWLGVRKSIHPVKSEWWGVGVVISLERGADCLHNYSPTDATATPKTPIISTHLIKSRLVLPFWYRLTQVVLEKRPLIVCSNSSGSRLCTVCVITPNAEQVHVDRPRLTALTLPAAELFWDVH